MYVLNIEDLSHLGGSMGTEYTTSTYQYYKKQDNAVKAAEKLYENKIDWKKKGSTLCSGDLSWVMFTIEEIKTED